MRSLPAGVRPRARWIELHHRNLTTIYVTHMHIDHYGGLSVLQRHFPDVRAIATPKSVELMPKQPEELDRHQYRRRTD